MPRALPSITIRSSISVRGNIATVPAPNLAFERLIGAEQKLLARLSAGIEGARDLRAAEGAVGQSASILTRKGNALRDALIDNVDADLGKPVDVGFARAKIAAFDSVVEEPVHAVAVVLIILRSIDAALRGDGVGAAGRILKAKAFDVIAEFAEGRGRGSSRQARADDDEGVLALVGGIDELQIEARLLPCLLNRTGR